jgi:cation transport ATPase
MATERPRRLTPSNAFLAASVVGVVTGIVLQVAGHPRAGDVAWAITTAVGIVPVAWEVLVAIRHRQAGVDLIALLAMAGALTFGAYSAGAVIALMLASGRSSAARVTRSAAAP